MNMTEKKYCLKRIDVIRCELHKDNVLRSAYYRTRKEEYALIKSGKVKLATLDDYERTGSAYRFGYLDDEENAKRNKAQAKVDNYNLAVDVKAGQISDEVMLGNSVEALALLEAFSKFKA